jgi:hypothetical protein
MKNRMMLLMCVMLLISSIPVTAIAQSNPSGPANSAGPESILNWNAIAQRTTIQVARQFPQQAVVYISYVQAAVYNAVVAIEGRYEPYKINLAQRPGASIDAAVAAAAHTILSHYFPAQQVALAADYAASLAAIPDGAAKDAGIAVGQESAVAIIALRQDDGVEADIGFVMPTPAPGAWQLPAGAVPQTPWLSQLRPFTLRSPDQFRPGPPPKLTSFKWALNFYEVKKYGGSNSPDRTEEQTDVARFWTMHPAAQYNAAFQQVVHDRGLDAVQAARLLAMGNLIGADSLIACFDAKYHYLFWRPQFAIPQGDTDGNPKTVGDPAWTPLGATPAHPEYPSAHTCLTAAEAEMFAAFFGTRQIDIDISSTVPNLLQPTRHYERVTDLVRELIGARIWIGFHYRDSMTTGVNVGRKVARWALARYFHPVDDDDDDRDDRHKLIEVLPQPLKPSLPVTR